MTEREIEKAVLASQLSGEKMGKAIIDVYIKHKGGLSLQADQYWDGGLYLPSETRGILPCNDWQGVLRFLRDAGIYHYEVYGDASGVRIYSLAKGWNQVFEHDSVEAYWMDVRPGFWGSWTNRLVITNDGCDHDRATLVTRVSRQ